MTDIPWNARLDASVDPVCVVFAPEWYHARAIASGALDVAPTRIHVSQFNDREMREYMMPRAMPAWKAKIVDEAQTRIAAMRCKVLEKAFGDEEPCPDCAGVGCAFQHYSPDQYNFDAVDCDTCDGTGRV